MNKDRSKIYNSLALIAIGLMINITGVPIARITGISLYLDSIGTVLAAVLGGYLPGIFVGFFTNVIVGISDPITLYYGILNISIAFVAAAAARRRWFSSVFKSLLAAVIFTFIGGGIGSVLTWLLYGFSFGSGISAQYAVYLNSQLGIPEFLAQLSADLFIDFTDKFIVVAIIYIVLLLLPDKLLMKSSQGKFYVKAAYPEPDRYSLRHPPRFSLRRKVVLVILMTATVIGFAATFISVMLYQEAVTNKHIDTASGITELMSRKIDADRINGYLESGTTDEIYAQTEAELSAIRDSMSDIEYMYVYQIHEDGCHVVFDIDTPELPGEELGAVVGHEAEFAPYYDDLIAGNEIKPVISHGIYGWLLTVYRPLHDSDGNTVAYAAADISMDDVVIDRSVFIIKIVALLFGAAMALVALAIWFAERQIIEPINAMTDAADKFAYDSEQERLNTTSRLSSVNIRTGDEIESLYNALSKTAHDVAHYIGDINEKTSIIMQMQSNIILSFAMMVENRDRNTGEHIKHTAEYVRLIVNELKKEGKYKNIIDDSYIESIVRSAPLHDIGKIEISDTILNKPGKLTAEEFEIMKTHTTVGRDILEQTLANIGDTDYFSAAMDMAAYHHERWDGGGYPEGLSGDAIPLSARIMAVADVFDALVSKRSYKEAMATDAAADIIRSESGSHFDPVVADAFLAVYPEVKRMLGK